MRVWVSRRDAERICEWAIEAGLVDLADRFYRVPRDARKMPLVWRRRTERPLLLRCEYCLEWESHRKHRWAKQSWVLFEGDWVHRACLSDWQTERLELKKARWAEQERRKRRESLFGNQEALYVHRDVLLRASPWYENRQFGLLDDMEAGIQADFGNERTVKLVNGMTDSERRQLVGVGFQGFHFTYHVLLGWVEEIPDSYTEGAELDDVTCHSFIVDELPKSLRELLPESKSALL